MRLPCIAFPSDNMLPPEGEYLCLDTASRIGWRGLRRVPDYDQPHRVLRATLPYKDDISVVIPGCEESVIAAGMINSNNILPGISLLTARRITYRAWQREMIERHRPDLNPRWQYLRRAQDMTGDLIVKAPASKLGLGCIHIKDASPQTLEWAELAARSRSANDEIRLSQVMGFDCHSIIEEIIPGPQVEISAIVNSHGRVARWLNPILQIWDDYGDRIERYEPYHEDAGPLRAMLRAIVDIFSLKSCGVNIETRQGKIIEVHARLGEEVGTRYHQLLCGDENPAQLLIDVIGGDLGG